MSTFSLQECGTVNRFKQNVKRIDFETRTEWRSLIYTQLKALNLIYCCDVYVGCTYLALFLREPYLSTFELIEKASYPMVSYNAPSHLVGNCFQNCYEMMKNVKSSHYLAKIEVKKFVLNGPVFDIWVFKTMSLFLKQAEDRQKFVYFK